MSFTFNSLNMVAPNIQRSAFQGMFLKTLYGLCPSLEHNDLHWEEKSCFLATILAVLTPC